MKRNGLAFAAALAAVLLSPIRVLAQQGTGAIKGHVQDAQGLAAAGATISVTSDSLMGARTGPGD